MVYLSQFRKDIQVTPEELKRALTPELRDLMAQSPNVGFSIESDYAFECVDCRDIGMDSYYRLLKESNGVVSRKNQVDKVKSNKGIRRLDKLVFEPEYSSHLNLTKRGLVCDHCKDSIHS